SSSPSARATADRPSRSMAYRSMSRAPHIVSLAVIAMTQLLACDGSTGSSVMDRRFDALSRAEAAAAHIHTAKGKAVIVGAMYDVLFPGPRDLNEIGDRDLGILYDAAYMTTFYTIEDRHIKDMTAFLGELQKRGLASKTHSQRMHATLVHARMWPDA